MRRGARDYIEKPWDDDKLIAAVQTQLELRRALRRSRRLQEENTRLQRRDLPTFIAEAPAMKAVRETIERVAPSDASVLITGEHGTGKEVVASLLHRLSTRATKPLVTMNAGGLSEGVAESELFGHVKGAFTDARTDRIGCFELADEGTLFLDEIANMPVKLQPKLLRVLQTGEVQQRRIVARDLRQRPRAVGDQRRSRRRDRRRPLPRGPAVPAEHRRHPSAAAARAPRGHLAAGRALPRAAYSDKYRRPFEGFDRSARQALESHLWPGNVRELGHAIERAVLMANGPADHRGRSRPAGARRDGRGASEEMTLEQAEKIFIQKVLARHGGDVRKAAEQLGHEPERALPAAAAVRALMTSEAHG